MTTSSEPVWLAVLPEFADTRVDPPLYYSPMLHRLREETASLIPRWATGRRRARVVVVPTAATIFFFFLCGYGRRLP
jgi:hypothetical protein